MLDPYLHVKVLCQEYIRRSQPKLCPHHGIATSPTESPDTYIEEYALSYVSHELFHKITKHLRVVPFSIANYNYMQYCIFTYAW